MCHQPFPYTISTDKTRLQTERIYQMLRQTHWAGRRTYETVLKSIENARCYGVYDGERQIGFCRVISDYATMYYISDVIVDPDYRNQGVASTMVLTIVNDEKFKRLMGILTTQKAHGFYEKHGFLIDNHRFMFKPRQD